MDDSDRACRGHPGVLIQAFVAFFIFTLVFLLNRFDVPHAVVIGGWEIYPSTALLPLGLAILTYLWGSRASLPRSWRDGYWLSLMCFMAWLVWALASTLINGAEGGINAAGLAALGSISLWAAPVWLAPCLPLNRKQTGQTLLAFILAAILGSWLSVYFSASASIRTYAEHHTLTPLHSDSIPRGMLPLGFATVIGLFYVTSLILSFVALGESRQRGMRKLLYFGIFSLSVGCLFTISRASLLIYVLVVLVSMFWLIESRNVRKNILKAVGVFLLLGLILMSLLDFSRLLKPFSQSAGASALWRIKGARVAAQMMRDAPILGHGIETHFKRRHGEFITSVIPPNNHDAITYRYWVSLREPHNLFLLVGAETGFVGLALYLGFLVSIGLFFYQRLGDAEPAWAKAGMLMMMVVLLHSIGGSDLVSRDRMSCLTSLALGLSLRRAIG